VYAYVNIMNPIKDDLNTRFNMALQSPSDRDFYENLYHYFEFIHKVPELKKIFDKSEREYSIQFGEIWKERRQYSEKELDEKSGYVSKLERFNLFSIGCTIYVRIYIPIDDYRKTNEPDSQQDIVAILLLRGVNYATSLKRWSKKHILMYNRWFDGQRGFYEGEFRRFHLALLDELATTRTKIKKSIKEEKPISKKEVPANKIKIYLDDNKGIYQVDKPDLSYPLKKISKRYKLIQCLISKDSISIYELSETIHQTKELTMKEISSINKLFRQKLSIPHDLIVHIATGGYSLNKYTFDIEISS